MLLLIPLFKLGLSVFSPHITIFAFVCTCMHGQYALLWHQVVEQSEEPFLHLSSILGTKDDHLALSKAERYARGRGHSLGVSISWELSSIQN